MVLTKKSKCVNCKALKRDDKGFACALGFKINFNEVNGEFYGPKPEDKCYKPMTGVQLSKAREMVKKSGINA